MKKLFSLVAVLLVSLLSFAQNEEAQVPKGLNTNDKIWVVMAVCVTILVGLFLYLIRLDKKVTRLEKGQ